VLRFDVIAGSDRASVTVHVTDVNDNSPIILFPVCSNESHCELDVSTPSPGDVMTRVKAVDPDDVGRQVRYELLGSETARRQFSLNVTSGEVSVRRWDSRRPLVHLLVRVTDSGRPPLSTSVGFLVRVNMTRLDQEGPVSSKHLTAPVVVVAVVVVVVVVCVVAARRVVVGPPAHTSITHQSVVVDDDIDDDVTCAADCSTDVAIGSSLRLQVTANTICNRVIAEYNTQ